MQVEKTADDQLTFTNTAPHVGTNITVTQTVSAGDLVEINSSTGNNGVMLTASSLYAGVMSKADKVKLDAIDPSADVNQNSYLTINAYRTATSNLISTGNPYGQSTTWVPSAATSVNDSISFFSGPGIDIRGGHVSSTATNEIQWDLDSDQRSVIKKIGVIGTGNMSIDTSATAYIYFDSHSSPSNTTGTHKVRFTGGGQIDAAGDIVAYASLGSSDRKLKENIQKVEGALELVSQLDGVTFDWKDKERGSSAGVIAQNVEEVLPSAVKDVDTLGEEGQTHKAVDYNQLSALFIEAIKELKEENKLLRAEIESLKDINN